mmetsp:Transcript_51204/g.51610  ORF Transcript_51204/g.51610 Transcript_51204/m.51610 type:complete len:108 (-) Transcript_51204:586-909(-)
MGGGGCPNGNVGGGGAPRGGDGPGGGRGGGEGRGFGRPGGAVAGGGGWGVFHLEGVGTAVEVAVVPDCHPELVGCFHPLVPLPPPLPLPVGGRGPHCDAGLGGGGEW